MLSLRLWNPRVPRSGESNRFVGLKSGPVPLDSVRLSEAYKAFYAPFVVTDHSRVLLYEGKRFLGWLGMLRCDGRAFEAREHGALSALIEPLRAALATAERLERSWDDAPIHVVLTPHGQVELASRAAEPWLDNRRLAGLRALLPAVSQARATRHFVDGIGSRAELATLLAGAA